MTVATASPPELEGEITYIIMIFHAKVNESLPEGSVSLVGLSMMCYTKEKAHKTCFGERQARGRMGKLL